MSSTKSVEEIKKQETWCDSHCSKTVGVWARPAPAAAEVTSGHREGVHSRFPAATTAAAAPGQDISGSTVKFNVLVFWDTPLPPLASKPALTDIPTLCLDFYSLLTSIKTPFLKPHLPVSDGKVPILEKDKGIIWKQIRSTINYIYHIFFSRGSPPMLHGGGGAQVPECPI